MIQKRIESVTLLENNIYLQTSFISDFKNQDNHVMLDNYSISQTKTWRFFLSFSEGTQIDSKNIPSSRIYFELEEYATVSSNKELGESRKQRHQERMQHFF